ncbi:MAG TPA: amidohydrolase family protein, partial [Saprospiraceae bacterium]|nr:amidohydrolase family protein [Saprospiraceae bacterium]
GNLNFILSLAAIKLKMLPAEAINALTLNGAAAMEVSATHGSITPLKSASLIITKPVSGLDYLPYSYGHSWIERVILEGKTL